MGYFTIHFRTKKKKKKEWHHVAGATHGVLPRGSAPVKKKKKKRNLQCCLVAQLKGTRGRLRWVAPATKRHSKKKKNAVFVSRTEFKVTRDRLWCSVFCMFIFVCLIILSSFLLFIAAPHFYYVLFFLIIFCSIFFL